MSELKLSAYDPEVLKNLRHTLVEEVDKILPAGQQYTELKAENTHTAVGRVGGTSVSPLDGADALSAGGQNGLTQPLPDASPLRSVSE